MSSPVIRSSARVRWPYWPTALVLLAGSVATVILCFWLQGKARDADQARLREEAGLQMEMLETRIELFVEMLKRLQDQISQTPVLDAARWEGLLYELNLNSVYPGISAMGWWLYQPPEKSLPGRESWRAIGLIPPHHSGENQEGRLIRSFHSVMNTNRTSHPLSIFSDEPFTPDDDLWDKIGWCLDVGPSALPSQEVFDGKRNEKDRGFHILLPVFFQERQPRALVEQRHAAAKSNVWDSVEQLVMQNDWCNLRGIVYGEFAMKQFVASTLGNRPRAVEFVLYDAPGNWLKDAGSELKLIYGSPPSPEKPPYLRDRLEMKHYGRRLVFDFWTTPAFAPHSLRHWPVMAALIGGCLTLLVASLVLGQTRGRLREAADAARLRAANEQITAALRDRERISRELHDGALQSIYAVGLGLAHCRNIFPSQPERVPALISETMDSINALVAELRQFLLTLEAEVLKSGSLEPLLRALARRVEATTSTHVVVEIDSAVAAAMPATESLHLINLVREAVSNSIRHGEPAEVRVSLSAAPGGWRLEIRDDGCGFDAEKIDVAPGHGVWNMRTRATELNAAFVLESKPRFGTLIRVECHEKTP